MRKTIKFWSPAKDNGFLSNFYISPFTLDNYMWDSVEHYYQANKFEDRQLQSMIRNQVKPKLAAKMGRRKDLPMRENWEEIKEEVMFNALYAKFSQNYALRERLLDTGDAFLIEDSPFDYYWGWGKTGKGKNRLGHLLMEVRKKLSDEDFIW
ncbi:MAG TPA: NADAR family protein [Massilibacterium sp.]|nr:NADAR family protein [Massilibacterium sp.]